MLNVVSNDDEMDELDDEVAMISNKKSQEGNNNNNSHDINSGILSTDDIKLEVKNQTSKVTKAQPL